MISDPISEDIPPQMKILNMVIPILMHCYIFFTELERCKPHKAARHPTIYDLVNKMVCATSKASDQLAHTRSLIRAIASRLHML